ncbi:inositol-pentakisphosphate 2-kinase [Massariosphaeria phaeospora]|uniref:Inositol-pentakisphosphate 2-kinase n=1 Tax=Massariosphaeria phaeospora TaxID=100035 RepID=A0A7C8MEB6_9PLEO|nr:inositol-pentakisphosphate 2-kinase [Massariosphaeria phaeospora]
MQLSSRTRPTVTKLPVLQYGCRTVAGPQEGNEISFNYLSEGGANYVFSIDPWNQLDRRRPRIIFVTNTGSVVPKNQVLGKVMRISKGVLKTLNSQEVISGLLTEIIPLFELPNFSTKNTSSALNTKQIPTSTLPTSRLVSLKALPTNRMNPTLTQHLMEHEGVDLPSEVIQELYDEVYQKSSHMGRERITLKVEAQWGILLPNLSSVPGKSLTIEVKPKWLEQSRKAPQDAYRCRNCALRASKPAEDKQNAYLCPLYLVAGNASVIQPWVKRKVLDAFGTLPEPQPEQKMVENITDHITHYIVAGKGHRLISHIKHQQVRLDTEAELKQGETALTAKQETSLRLAMTLKDCSLYIKVSYSDKDLPIESWLGDLDFKSPQKIKGWGLKETALVDGGWYTQRDVGGERLDCMISAARDENVALHHS